MNGKDNSSKLLYSVVTIGVAYKCLRNIPAQRKPLVKVKC